METRHRIHPAILTRAREMRHPQTRAETTLNDIQYKLDEVADKILQTIQLRINELK